MKKLFSLVLLLGLALNLVACVDHNDGVCDYKGCDRTLTVVRYDKTHEFCLEHALEEGLED